MAAIPREIRLTDARQRLDVVWEDGSVSRLPASTLRAQSRSADSVRAEIDDLPPAMPADLAITEILPIGAYAVNLVFSDGYRRGIFPWPFLRELADAASARA